MRSTPELTALATTAIAAVPIIAGTGGRCQRRRGRGAPESNRQELRGSHDLRPFRRFHESVGGWLLALECCEMQAPFYLTHRA